MFKSKIEQFVAKKAVICLILLSIIDIIAINYRWLVLVGLFSGTILSVAKFGSYAWVFGRICSTDQGDSSRKQASGSSITVYMLNQLILLPLLFLTYFLNRWIFTGFVAGILIVPFVIMINSITEVLGITKNHFE